MKILLDNCVHQQVAQFFVGHDVKTAVEVGWAGLANGELLARASKQFDILVTTDKNLRHQQNLRKLPMAIIELHSRDTRIESLRAFTGHVLRAVEKTRTHKFVGLHADGRMEELAKRSG